MTNPFELIIAKLEALESKIDSLPTEAATTEPIKELLTRTEAMELLNIRTNKLRDMTRDGIFTAYHIGTRIMYKRTELLASLEQLAA